MSELRTNRIVPRDGLATGTNGGIIQVVQNVQGIGQVNSGTYGTSEYDIGLSCTITPHRSDSKILINANWPAIARGQFYPNFYLSRGTTHIHEYQTYMNQNDWQCFYPNMVFLDSPATTSAVTYKITAQVTSGHDLRTNYNKSSGDDTTVHGELTGYGSRSTMILMEVSG
tara:strand:- start:29 stop:538 length:510 start_codon:yes stop_codon:yes gene_type:complete